MRLGTRASPLALAQAKLVADQLETTGFSCKVVPITTTGDSSAPTQGDKTRWVKQLDEALLAGEIDFAVHSAKDIPGILPDGIQISAVLARANPHDGICFATTNTTHLRDLPAGSCVGTSSLRRAAQITALRGDIVIKPVRGNVGTRLKQLYDEKSSFDAIILAMAGLERLDKHELAYPLPADEIIPAPGQGTIAITSRLDDDLTCRTIKTLNEPTTWTCLTIERRVAQKLGATCDTPLGVYARYTTDSVIQVKTFFGEPDGSRWVRDELTGNDPSKLADQAAQRIQTTYMVQGDNR